MTAGQEAPGVLGARSALPAHVAHRDEALPQLLPAWGGQKFSRERVEQLHRSLGVETRHFALPLDDYLELDTFAKRNDVWVKAALELGCEAVSRALEAAGVQARDVDHIFFTTVTGIAVP